MATAHQRRQADLFLADLLAGGRVRRRARDEAPLLAEEFPTGRFVAAAGNAGPEGAEAAARLLDNSAAGLESGALVRAAIGPGNDRFATYICDSGSLQRGFIWREARSGRRAGQCIIHPGQDIAAPARSPVRAMRSGIVEHSGLAGGYGEAILLRHADGSTSWYGHMDERQARRGQLVEGGEVIGLVGKTSSIGLAPSDLRLHGTPADPRCQGFPNMNPHLHLSVHGVRPLPNAPHGPDAGRRTLPARPPRRRAVRAYGGADVIDMLTDDNGRTGEVVVNEYTWGVDAAAYLASVSVRPFAATAVTWRHPDSDQCVPPPAQATRGADGAPPR